MKRYLWVIAAASLFIMGTVVMVIGPQGRALHTFDTPKSTPVSDAQPAHQTKTSTPAPDQVVTSPPTVPATQTDTPQMVVPTPQTDVRKPYNGPIEHLFFHPLLAYPERAFDGDGMSRGFDDWFVTVKEFHSILESLYRNQYMLVDIRTIAKDAGKLQMPEGKKPLILSIDDINYYDYMLGNGTVSKLIVDAEGRIATVSKDRDGSERVAYDNEIVPIVDAFVRKHPDFSLDGAKGMLNVTGYEGILGYRTNLLQAEDYKETKNQAIRVVEALKANGWSFASHGWGHLDAKKINHERLVQDTKRWKEEVEPLVGATSVYVFPYGSSVLPGDRNFQALLDAGFHVFCSVGPNPYLRRTPQYTLMDRRHIDGVALRGQAARLAGLFDAKAVVDPIRPKLR